jgi:hypothetical protein
VSRKSRPAETQVPLSIIQNPNLITSALPNITALWSLRADLRMRCNKNRGTSADFLKPLLWELLRRGKDRMQRCDLHHGIVQIGFALQSARASPARDCRAAANGSGRDIINGTPSSSRRRQFANRCKSAIGFARTGNFFDAVIMPGERATTAPLANRFVVQ